jgi:hypothetical protein
MSDMGGMDVDLWDEEDGFFYDVVHLPDGTFESLKVRTLVGLIPLLGVQTVRPEMLDDLPDFRDRLQWFVDHRPDLATLMPQWNEPGKGSLRLLSLVHGHRCKQVLARMLDPQEFLSDHGIRSISAYYRDHPYVLNVDGTSYEVTYEPGESDSGEFGGSIHTGAIFCRFTNTSTETPPPASAPATKPAGRHWWPTYSHKKVPGDLTYLTATLNIRVERTLCDSPSIA